MAKVTNNAAGTRVVNAKVDGKVRQVPLTPGETRDLDLVETKAMKGRIESGDIVVGKSVAKAKEPAPTGYAVVDKGRGWHVVTKDGEEVTKSLREDDVKGFTDLSDEDKAAFVDLHKPE